ncbi:MAG: universal stress protein [Polyangiales bacterium]
MSPCERVVVVGVDFTEMGDDAILEGLTQVVTGAASVARFVYVHDPRVVGDDPTWRDGSGRAARRRVLSALRQRVRDVAALAHLAVDPTQVRVHARVGHTVAALIGACIEHDADLLIIGTHARLALDRRVLGPIADTLVRTAPCTVLIARPKSRHDFRRLPWIASAVPSPIAGRAPIDEARQAS